MPGPCVSPTLSTPGEPMTVRRGFNPSRRNRKIGTPDHAWRDRAGARREFDLPWPRWEERSWGTRPGGFTVQNAGAHGDEVTIVVERPRTGCVHACAPEDVWRVLGRLPAIDVSGLGLVVLRQSTRKEEIFDWKWGSIWWSQDFRGYSGPTIILDAAETAEIGRAHV